MTWRDVNKVANTPSSEQESRTSRSASRPADPDAMTQRWVEDQHQDHSVTKVTPGVLRRAPTKLVVEGQFIVSPLLMPMSEKGLAFKNFQKIPD